MSSAEICGAFLKGTCRFGDKCKFNHDLAAYVKQRPGDLPGPCPFSGLHSQCPFSIACRWATSHTHPDEFTKQYLLSSANDEAGRKQKTIVLSVIEKELHGSPHDDSTWEGMESEWWRKDGSIPESEIGIVPGDSIASSYNLLKREVQAMLRKNVYPFMTADAVLEAHGLRTTQKGKQKRYTVDQVNGVLPVTSRKKQQETKRPRLPESSKDDSANFSNHAHPAMDAIGSFNPHTKSATENKCQHESGTGDRTTDVSNFDHRVGVQPQRHAESSQVALDSQDNNGHPYVETGMHPRERRRIDFTGKTFLAPLTTVGNLPFRRLCKTLGADITCGEMALATNLLQGQTSEWALLRRHPDEDCFGVQICGGYPDAMARCAQLVEEHCQVDFVDINFGCPIDCIVSKQAGSACLKRPQRMCDIVSVTSKILSCPLTLKMRKGFDEGEDVAHELIPRVSKAGASAVVLHGRTREQRYSRLADWGYIARCAEAAVASEIQLIGNGDVLGWEDHQRALSEAKVATTYVARGALIKPWVFTEIKESRDWDISASERLDIVRRFASFGLEHWGSDARGVETTRRFLLEWLSFAHRYVPVGLLEALPQRTNQRPPAYVGRSDLETLLSSPDPHDWISVTELVLGPSPEGFRFTPKHKASSYGSQTVRANAQGEKGIRPGGSQAGKEEEDQENG